MVSYLLPHSWRFQLHEEHVILLTQRRKNALYCRRKKDAQPGRPSHPNQVAQGSRQRVRSLGSQRNQFRAETPKLRGVLPSQNQAQGLLVAVVLGPRVEPDLVPVTDPVLERKDPLEPTLKAFNAS